MWSEAQLRKLRQRGGHCRVRAETFEELHARAAEQQLELKQLEARHKEEAKTIASLSGQLQDRLAAEKLPPNEALLAALLQQALVHGVDGEMPPPPPSLLRLSLLPQRRASSPPR